jgi:hypothetical protein
VDRKWELDRRRMEGKYKMQGLFCNLGFHQKRLLKCLINLILIFCG